MHADKFQKAILVDQAIAGFLADQLLISAPAPISWMGDYACANHIEIYVLNAIPQMLAVLDHSAVVSVVPKGSAPMLAPVEIAGKIPLQLLHHAADTSGPGLDGSLMGVVRGEAIIQQGYTELSGHLPEPLAIFGAVTGKFKQELTIVTAMSQVADLPRLNDSIRSWHALRIAGCDSRTCLI